MHMIAALALILCPTHGHHHHHRPVHHRHHVTHTAPAPVIRTHGPVLIAEPVQQHRNGPVTVICVAPDGGTTASGSCPWLCP